MPNTPGAIGKGITANAILPGFVDTEMVQSEAAAAADGFAVPPPDFPHGAKIRAKDNA